LKDSKGKEEDINKPMTEDELETYANYIIK